MMTFLQLVGSGGGLACTILIYLWVADERQMDRLGRNDERLFEVMEKQPGEKGINTSEQTPGLLATALAAEMPEVQNRFPLFPVSWSDKQTILSVAIPRFIPMPSSPAKTISICLPIRLSRAIRTRCWLIVSISSFKNACPEIVSPHRWPYRQKIHHLQPAGFGDPVLPFPACSTTRRKFPRRYSTWCSPHDLFLDKKIKKLADWRNGDPQTFVLLKPGSSVEVSTGNSRGFLKTEKPADQSFAVRTELFPINTCTIIMKTANPPVAASNT